MTRLRACDACSRHVFVTEASCPFCGAALEPQTQPPAARVLAGASRAQRFALAAAVAGQTLAGCAETTDGLPAPDASVDDAGASAGSGGAGGKAGDDGGAGTAGWGQPVYGAPFPDDASVDAKLADDDAGEGDDELGLMPLYGLPPFP